MAFVKCDLPGGGGVFEVAKCSLSRDLFVVAEGSKRLVDGVGLLDAHPPSAVGARREREAGRRATPQKGEGVMGCRQGACGCGCVDLSLGDSL